MNGAEVIDDFFCDFIQKRFRNFGHFNSHVFPLTCLGAHRDDRDPSFCFPEFMTPSFFVQEKTMDYCVERACVLGHVLK